MTNFTPILLKTHNFDIQIRVQMLFNDTQIPTDKYKIIETELEQQGRSIQWLANNLELCYQHTRRLIRGKHPIPENVYQKMQELLSIKN